MEVQGCDLDDLGVESAPFPQLLQARKVAVGCQGGLEIHRHAPSVRQELVVGFLFCHLRLSAGKIHVTLFDEMPE